MQKLRDYKVSAYIGYLPLHSSPKGLALGNEVEDCAHTEDLANRIVRLPFYTELGVIGLEHCIDSMEKVLTEIYGVL